MAQTSLRGFLDFSPIRNTDKENDIPVLRLIQFSKAPFVTFGSVKLGTSKSAILLIENPTKDAEAEVAVDKISSTKGFSVDHSRFVIQPDGSFTLTITWTPTEEGGIRDLVIFNANGVLKHQAVLLGRAEAPKKKKKSLWDSIKNKRAADPAVTPRGKKTESMPKLTANKTFQVSRKAHYKRGKPRSPLASLNMGTAVREKSISKSRAVEGEQQKATQRPRSSAQSDRLRAPALTVSAALALIESDLDRSITSLRSSHSSCNVSDCLELVSGNLCPGRDEPSLKAIPVSPDLSESNGQRCTFFVSKKTAAGHLDEDPTATSLRTVQEVRKTSIASVTVTKGKAPAAETVLNVCSPGGRRIRKSKRRLLEKTLELSGGSSPWDSAPGTPGLPVIDSDSGTESTQQQSRAIGSLRGALRPSHGTGSPTPVTFPIASPSDLAAAVTPSTISFTVTSPASPPLLPAPGALATSSPHISSPLSAHLTFCESSPPLDFPLSPVSVLLPSVASDTTAPPSSLPPASEDLLFPVHTRAEPPANGKKRKSDEYLRGEEGAKRGAARTERVKRTRVAPGAQRVPVKPAQEKSRVAEKRQRQPRAAGSVRSASALSMKTTRSVAFTAKQPTVQGACSLKAFAAGPVRIAKVVAVAQAKLTFVKPAQTAIPRHPMPFAAKNMFYDERWMEKQESGFTCWINYVLTPDDFKVNTEVTTVNALSIAMGSDGNFGVPKAPTKEELSFSTYTARRRLNRLRRSACQLFTSEAMVKAIQRLELEVEARRLLVRKDRHLWKDIGERQKVLNWLLSYNPLWLRIGLETIYGELLPLESNSDTLGLAMFVLGRLLWNPDLAAEFRHARVPHLYKDGHLEALSRFTLKKLLLLVCFLDKAKDSRLIEHDPCLFCMDSQFKTSKDLLLAFARDFLSGEGILPRHLGYLGLPVSHVQTPLDEFNFAVKNLSVDLKCGIRLVRVLELFTQDWSLSRRLRLPAISRLQKIHNVDIALQALTAKGVDLRDEHGSTVDSRDIVDGHREKTLSLLWKVIFTFQVEVILDEQELREEIAFLKRTLRTKWRLACLKADGLIQKSASCRGPTTVPFATGSTKITLLMEWVNAVCNYYNLRVENFTVSFSDGRVLCYLIHHYHPSCLSAEAISHSTTQTVDCSPRGSAELDCSGSDSDNFDPSHQKGPESPSLEFKELLGNERSNFRLVNSAVAFLGGVPAMINPADMSNTIPNEKVVTSYLSFLCARLLDLRNETRAARVIQGAWRGYKLKKDLQLFQQRNLAAAKIQVLVKRFLQRRRTVKQISAVILIQARWRGYAARNAMRLKRESQLRALQNNAANIIQAQWKMYAAKTSYQRLRYHVIVVQAEWRMRRAATAYRRIQWATAVMQNRARAWAVARRDRERYASLRTAAVQIQRVYRRRKARRLAREHRAAGVIQAAFRKWHTERTVRRVDAALKIQSWYRMHSCSRHYAAVKKSAVVIQALCRGWAQRRCFLMLKLRHRSALTIQSTFRGQAARKRLAEMRRAAILVQRWFRACVKRDVERQRFVAMRRAAVVLQAAYRGNSARASMRAQRRAATVIQAEFRRFVSERRYAALKRGAAVIQQRYRATVLARKAKEEYDTLRSSALVIQSVWRGILERKRLEKLHRYATLLQASYRRHSAQAQYRSTKAAVVVLQHRFRDYMAGKAQRAEYLQLKAAAITLQAGFQGMVVRRQLKQRHHASTRIQSVVRMHICRKRYLLLQSAAIIVQSRYRALAEGRAQQLGYRQLRQATITVQAAYRGYRARGDLRKRHAAATVIQAHFRMYRVRMAYLATRCATIIIQERYRAKRLGNQQAQRYRAKRSAAVIIQAAFRGFKSRQGIRRMHQAASAIQRAYRSHYERERYLALKKYTVTLQRRYRASLAAKREMQGYRQMRRAVILLQAAYKGHRVRKEISCQHQAATMIQALFRKHRQQMKFQAMRLSAIIVQRRYRACVLQRTDRSHYLRVKQSAVVLQAAVRGYVARKKIFKMHQAATVIQANYRKYKQQLAFRRQRWAALVVQQRFRAQRQRSLEVKNYQRVRNATVTLQAAYQGMKSRQRIKRMHQAASAIQLAYRAHCERERYLNLKKAIVTLQRRYRANLAAKRQMQGYQQMRRAVILLQAAYKGHQVRKEISCQHQAATMIQALFRKHRQEMKFQAMRLSAIIIQRHYRACVLQRTDRSHYLRVKQSAVVLQAAVRGYVARKKIFKMHQAATVIQANYRKYKQQLAFRRQRWAALVVQQRFRAQRQRSLEVKNYQRVRNATVTLQAAYRGMKSRQRIKRMHQAASAIQLAYRAHCERERYLNLKKGIVTLQRRYRASLAAKRQMQGYQQMRRAVILLQAAYKGHQVRKEISCQHQAATLIQALFRKHRQQMKFQAMRLSAIIIQRRYRACVLQRADRSHYLRVKQSAVILQAAVRGYVARKKIFKIHQAATVIQANYRKYKQQLAFRRQRWAALVVQQRFRAQRQRSLEVKNYQRVRNATVTLQAAYQGMKSRQRIKRMHQAASAIQLAYRAHCERERYLNLKKAIVTLQRRYRASLAAKRQMQGYQQMRRAVILLQAAYKGHRVRKEISCQHQAATLIQALFRKHRQQMKFQAMRLSAIIIQRHYRACVLQRTDRSHYLRVKQSAVVLQAAVRGYVARKKIFKMHQAATVIQANYRKYKQQLAFRRQRWAALVVQQRFRAQRQRSLEVKNYQRVRNATVTLQAAYRAMKSRQRIKRMHQAASAIQLAYRAHCERERYLNLKKTIVTLQRRYRASLAAKRQMQGYQQMRRAVILLQAAYKGHRVRKEISCQHQAATLIQALFRKHRQQMKFQAMRLSAIIVQRRYRACVLQRTDRSLYLRVKQSAVILQAAVRGYVARKKIFKMHQAATVIQANYRKYKQQLAFRRQHWAALVVQQRFRAQRQRSLEVKNYQRVRNATVTLQAAYQGMKSRQRIKRMHQAASAIQLAYRAHCERERYLNLKKSIVTLQRRYRASLAAKRQMQGYQQMRRAVILLQAAYKGHRVRKEISCQHQAATLIQALFRKHRQQMKFQAMRLSAIIIQRRYRACVLQRADRSHYLAVRQSTVILQAAVRGHYVRKAIWEQNHAATIIQSCWRGFVQRCTFQRWRVAAVTLQRRLRAAWLARAVRQDYNRTREATVTLQAHCRGWIARRQLREAAQTEKRRRFSAAAFHHLSAMRLQRALRAHWALQSGKREIYSVIRIQRWVRAWQQRRRYLEERRKVVTAQRVARRWLARRHRAAAIIQHATQRFLMLRRQQRTLQGIIKAQALWRGHHSRMLRDDPTLVGIRHHLRKVSASVQEEDKLGNKTASALDYLLRYKHFSCILEALKNLETATRLSPECCERLVESGATLVIFTLIRSCNRSVPCMDVITSSIQILLNLSKYHKTAEAVYAVENSVDTLLDLLQRYRDKAGDKVADKGGSIFTKACFLLALLLQDQRRALEVRRMPKALDRICSIYRLTARKCKMDTKRTVVKQKMNASFNGSFLLQTTPLKSRPVRKFAPDWVLRKDSLKDIVDPLGAIKMVAETFSIVL